MTVDFADHFWGEKNNGFAVLYQNMKHGQSNVKELVNFLRERAAAEEDYQKRLTLISKQISTYGTVGTFGPVWQMVRSSLEKISQLHSELVKKLQELSKEVQKYGDEQQKHHKDVKDKESKTFDAVNYIQTTTTCLQKARENYFARCIEHEKLKKENATAKEITKSEARMKKASEEYKMYVEKYSKVRDDFEDRMIKAARSFQQAEENHLGQMKLFTSAYAQNIQGSYVQVNQVYGDFLDQMTSMDIDVLLQEFIEKRETGTEKPLFYFYEEPDLSSISQPVPGTTFDAGVSLMGPDTTGSAGSAHAPSSADSSPNLGRGGRPQTPPVAVDLLLDSSTVTNAAPQQQKKLSLWLPGRNKKQGSSGNLKPSGSTGSTMVTPSPSTETSLGMFTIAAANVAANLMDAGKFEGEVGVGSKNSLATESRSMQQAGMHHLLSASQSVSSSSVTATGLSGNASGNFPSSSYALFGNLPAGSAEETTAQQKRRERSLSMGFLRKKKEKKKKNKETDNQSVQSSEDTKSKTSAESTEGNATVLVDKEGFSVIPEDHHNHMRDNDGKYSCSSDSESDDDQPQKIKVEIKPLATDTLQKSSASIDELRDAIGNMSSSNSSNTLKGWSSSTACRSGEDMTLDFFDPMSSRNYSSMTSNDPWRNGKNQSDVKLLRPAKTGDDRFNNRSFAGDAHFGDNFAAPMLPPRHPPPPPPVEPWPMMDESRDRLSDLSSSSLAQSGGQWPSGTAVGTGAAAARSRPRSTTPTHMITLANNGGGGLKRANASVRSTTNNFGDTTLTHSDSMGSLDQLETNTLSSSRGNSPLAQIGPSDVVPLAMALTETVHVLFKATGETRCVCRVYGNVALSFPSSIVNALAMSLFSSGTGVQRPPLTFQLTNADKIAAVVPNRQVLNQTSTFQPGSSHQFECNMPALIAQLKRLVDASPSASFCNLDLLRYELKSTDLPNSNNNVIPKTAPMMMQSFWKCEADHTDIRIDYQYNTQCAISAPLLNLTFSTDVNGNVNQVNSKPEALWTATNNKLQWRLTELSRHGDCSGSLKARLTLSSGPSTPAATAVQFQINEHTLSGADLQLCSNGVDGTEAYRLSLLKKKVVSGKYSCEPEQR